MEINLIGKLGEKHPAWEYLVLSRLFAAQGCNGKLGPILSLTYLFCESPSAGFSTLKGPLKVSEVLVSFYKSSTATTVHCSFTAHSTASEICVKELESER